MVCNKFTCSSDYSCQWDTFKKEHYNQLFCIPCHREATSIEYHNKPKYWDRQASANSVDPDHMPQNVASDQGLHCLPLIQQYSRHISR